MHYIIKEANSSHFQYAVSICEMMKQAAQVRGTGIAKRTPDYIKKKMESLDSVIAIHDGIAIGFCYIETWENKKYVANSGLIVHADYRKVGLAKEIKKKIFELSKKKYPDSILFGITTSMAVMKINTELGYKPVTFSELPKDEIFWNACKSCANYDVLTRTNKTMCLCTGMINDSKLNKKENKAKKIIKKLFKNK